MSSSASAASKSAGRKAKTAAAPEAAAAAPAPVAAKAAKAAAPVASPAPAAAAPVATEAAHEEVNIAAKVTAAVEKVNSLRTALAAVYSDLKVLEKQVPRELKKAQKGRRNRKTEGGEDKPKKETVFTKPTPISDALCTFLGVAKGSSVSRSEVTSKVCAYAKQKGLMDKQNIKADAALRKLLALTDKDELKILNLQRYLKPHYIKPATA